MPFTQSRWDLCGLGSTVFIFVEDEFMSEKIGSLSKKNKVREGFSFAEQADKCIK